MFIRITSALKFEFHAAFFSILIVLELRPFLLPDLHHAGLGKTCQVVAFLAALHHSQRLKTTLVVCPATVMHQARGVGQRMFPSACIFTALKLFM